MSIESLRLVADINGDGSYSLWEIWEVVKFFYRLPGNLLVEGLGHIPYVSSFLGIHASQATGYGSLDGLLSVTLSLLVWVGVLFTILTLSSPTVDEVDEEALRTPEPSPTELRSGIDDTQAKGARHGHLPVSRASYTAHGKRPRKHHRLAGLLARHARQ